jgi:deoxyribodipyrimidine photolyase-related protein
MAEIDEFASIVLPNQLFEKSPLLLKRNKIFLVEEFLFFKNYKFHKQKLIFHRLSMKKYENYLKNIGFDVEYVDSISEISDIRNLIEKISIKFKSITIIDPVDYLIEKRLMRYCKKFDIKLNFLDNPMFINKKVDPDFFKPEKKKFFQTSFYKLQRKKTGILIDDSGKPEGGDWTYDVMNREKYPINKIPPKVKSVVNEKILLSNSLEYVEKNYLKNPGNLNDDFYFPTDFEQSRKWFESFLEERFKEFGPYEDSIVDNEIFLNHSLLSPLLNSGLLDINFVLDRTIVFYNKNDIPLNSCEGFIRQIIGWREFIRGIYTVKGSEERTKNFWGFKRKIPKSFYDASTGILPVDNSIRKILKTGYAHHIERLMILGNFMLLCEFDPDEVYRWFMEMFIDSYDWVMVPNVYGMSQFADGGLMSTKPYISGSSYILKMSNYKKGEWSGIWDSLFWNFIDNHRDFFDNNPRMRMLVRNFDKMDIGKRTNLLKSAHSFLENLN